MPAARRPARVSGGYTYDEALRRYRDPRGRIVSRETIRRAIDDTLARTEGRALALATELQAGRITLAAWEIEMRALIKDVHLYGAAAVRGGWDRLTPGDLGRVGQLVRTQYGYLENFAAELERGVQPMNGRFRVRAGMYAQAGRGTHEAFAQSDARRAANEQGGALQALNLLGDATHCSECLDLSAAGWMPDADMPLPGHRTCLTRCQCRLERRVVGGQPPLDRFAASGARARAKQTRAR
jgi:hypothetical protein